MLGLSAHRGFPSVHSAQAAQSLYTGGTCGLFRFHFKVTFALLHLRLKIILIQLLLALRFNYGVCFVLQAFWNSFDHYLHVSTFIQR